LLQLLLLGILSILASMAHAREDIGGRAIADEPVLQKWKSEDGQELYELRIQENAISFERITPPQDRMYGEYFKGTAGKAGAEYRGSASAAVLQITQGRPTHTCTLQMSLTLATVTPARIIGNVRLQHIDPQCAPNNFSATMTAPAFAWIPAAENDVPLPQIQRRIEVSIQYRRRMEAADQRYQQETLNRQAELELGQRINLRLRGCDAALRQQYVICSAHYPYNYPGRTYFPRWGACGDAQTAVMVACY
jgi:hypothetical protein